MENLANKLKVKQEARERFYALQRWLYERRDEILGAPMYIHTDFWCNTCKRDFTSTGYKEVRVPNQGVWFAYYVGICPCGAHALRYITDKLLDPYWYKSKVIKTQQGQYADEMLQPWQPRFKQIYPEQYRKLYLQEQGIALK